MIIWDNVSNICNILYEIYYFYSDDLQNLSVDIFNQLTYW